MPYIDNNKIKIHYETVGSGLPIIMHHGLGNSIPDWYELGYVDALKNDYQLVMLDCRGFGKSSKPHDPKLYDLKLRASDTVAVMDHLNIKQAVAFGNSMGARLVYALMRHYPERFACFIAAGLHPYEEETKIGRHFARWLERGMDYTMQQLEKNSYSYSKAMRARYLENDSQAMLAAYKSSLSDSSATLPKITAPVLLFAGNNDPVAAKLQEAVKLLPDGELILIDDYDHGRMYWDGKLSAELIKNFLRTKQDKIIIN